MCGGGWIKDSGAAVEGVWCRYGKSRERMEEARESDFDSDGIEGSGFSPPVEIKASRVLFCGLGCGMLTIVAAGDDSSSAIPPSLKSPPFPSDTARRKPSTMKMLVKVRKNSDVPCSQSTLARLCGYGRVKTWMCLSRKQSDLASCFGSSLSKALILSRLARVSFLARLPRRKRILPRLRRG